MKKVKGRMLLILAACLVMLVTGAVSVSAATLKAGSEGVTTTGVNMRSKASKSASRLTTIPRGYTVYIKGAAGGWYHVYYNGKTGYCSSNYVKDIITVAKNKWMTTRVMAASIRMRKSASSNAKVLLTIKSGKRVVILGKTSSGRWYKVSSYGRIGYVEAGYFTTDAKTLYAKSGVNMRKGPATSYKRILTVPKGGKVICYKKVNGWWQCKYNGRIGYISGSYLSAGRTSSSGSASTTVSSGTKKKTTAGVALRSGPGRKYSYLDGIDKNEYVQVLKTQNGWSYISYNGEKGWVSSSYLKKA